MRFHSQSKPITIIQRERLLLNNTYPDKYRIAIQKQIEARGVTVLTNDAIPASDASDVSASQVPKDGFVTEQGKKLKPDLVVSCYFAHHPHCRFVHFYDRFLHGATAQTHPTFLPTFSRPPDMSRFSRRSNFLLIQTCLLLVISLNGRSRRVLRKRRFSTRQRSRRTSWLTSILQRV